MELILIFLVALLLNALLIGAFFIGYHFGKKQDGVRIDKTNAEPLKELAELLNYGGKL